jgi:hypothetical protein
MAAGNRATGRGDAVCNTTPVGGELKQKRRQLVLQDAQKAEFRDG